MSGTSREARARAYNACATHPALRLNQLSLRHVDAPAPDKGNLSLYDILMRSNRWFLLSLVAGIVIAVFATVIVLALKPAEAHRASKWYGSRWHTEVVRWSFDNDFPRGGGIRKAVRKGSRQWNRAGADLRFRSRREAEAGRVNPCARRRRNFVDWRRIDGPGGRLAVTVVCSFGDGRGPDTMYAFHMIFDKSEPWHKDPSTRPTPLEVDLWSVAAHEFGHAGGRISGGPEANGHFAEGSRWCPRFLSGGRHTMCPSEEVLGAEMRTLERHDIDVFRNAYDTRR